ncbi:MAG: hypothetical protein WC713_02630 [Candidatus Methylomirabilota bacterium]
MKRGLLLNIEGTDASGKNTQATLLVERLNKNGFPCETLSFPRYNTPTGKIIGDCYLGKTCDSWFGDANSVPPEVASLYYAADRKAAAEEIIKKLDSGRHIILDRYVESNMGHQGGKKSGEDRIKIINFINNLEYGLLKLPRPDAIIFLYMPYLAGMELKKGRAGKADGHESNAEHLKNAEETYLQLADMFGWTKIECAPDGTIKSLRKKEDISEEVYEKVMNLMKK